jgi:hypothetical protein
VKQPLKTIYPRRKTKKKKNLIPALLLPAVVAAMPTYSQIAVSIPTAKNIIESAKKAVGGDAYFNIKPYYVSYTNMLNDADPRQATIKGYYKNGKWYTEATILKIKNQFTFSAKTITDVYADKTWESQSTLLKGKWKQIDFPIRRLIPFYVATQWERAEFEAPTIIKENGAEYYRLHAINPNNKDWTYTLLINVDSRLVYKLEEINTKTSFVITNVFSNYNNFGGIMLPLEVIRTEVTHWRGKRNEMNTVTSILDFVFKTDIPDSLFVVPKK